LFYSLVVQLHGNPAFLTEQMGGEPLTFFPSVRPMGPLALLRAGVGMMREWRRVTTGATHNFAVMKQMTETYSVDRIQHLSLQELTETLDHLRRWLDGHEVTFGILGGVAQSLQALGTFLPGWLGSDWRELLNASLQGQGAVISAQQIVRLAELVEAVRSEPVAQQWFLSESALDKEFRDSLAGTNFLSLFEHYLADYGHRAVGESDVMSPRMADQPEAVLALVRTHVRSGKTTSAHEIVSRQTQRREAALVEITKRFGRRRHRGLIFRWWYRRLCRFSVLREANRHHLMYYSTVVRHLLLRLGERMVDQGTMTHREDVFFLTVDECAVLGREASHDWCNLVRERREERARNETIQVPDSIQNREESGDQTSPSTDAGGGEDLRGIAISAGVARGPVRIVRSTTDWKRVRAGDILVVAVIDPGMAPLFGVAAGLVAEMGGTLSHGAIIAREYGLPVLVNVPDVTSLLRENEQIQIECSTGTIRRVIP
jgi:pyruvate,water dikinase